MRNVLENGINANLCKLPNKYIYAIMQLYFLQVGKSCIFIFPCGNCGKCGKMCGKFCEKFF